MAAGSGRNRLAAAAGVIVATVLVAVVVTQRGQWGNASTRPASAQPSVLLGEDGGLEGGMGELLAQGRMGEGDHDRLAAAQRLLLKARRGFAENDGTVTALEDAARRGDAALGTPAQIARSVTREVRNAEQEGAGGEGQGLHFTRGWPQAGGVMPTHWGEASDWGQHDNYYYPHSDGQTWSKAGGAGWDGQGMDVGVVGGGPKKYANGWDSAGDAGSGSNPLYWFLRGARQAGNAVFPARRVPWVRPSWDSDSSAASGAGGYPSTVQEPVHRLLMIREQRAKLKRAEDRIASKVFENAAHGLMSGYVAGSPDEESYVGGFLQGAVQASRKSVEQQGDFAKQLESQAQIVKRLEDIVAELEDEMRKQNWKKTEDKVSEGGGKEPKEDKEEKEVSKPTFDVEFYMEAECPACKAFATHVVPAVLNAFGDMINLTAVPFGNAAVVNGTIHCQHGPTECVGNKIELCVMDRTPRWQDWYPVFKCIEKSDDSPLNASKKCLPKYGYDTDDILDCAHGDKGELLHLAAAKQTLGLDPPHKWTPWIVMDGKPLGTKAGSILGMICKKLPEGLRAGIQACNPKYGDTQHETLAAFDGTKGYCYPDKALSSLMLSN